MREICLFVLVYFFVGLWLWFMTKMRRVYFSASQLKQYIGITLLPFKVFSERLISYFSLSSEPPQFLLSQSVFYIKVIMVSVLFIWLLKLLFCFSKKLSEILSALRKFPFRRPCNFPASVSPLNRIFYLLISSFSLSAIFIRHHLKLNIRVFKTLGPFWGYFITSLLKWYIGITL